MAAAVNATSSLDSYESQGQALQQTDSDMWNEKLSHILRRLTIEMDVCKSVHREQMPTYDFMRQLAVQKLQCDVVHQLRVIDNENWCKVGEGSPTNIHYRPFSWSLDDFLERRMMNTTIWIDVLKREVTPDCLETLKLSCDLQELMHYLKMLFDALLQAKDRQLSVVSGVLQQLEAVDDYLKLGETLPAEMEKNKETLHTHINTLIAFDLTKQDPKQLQIKLNLEETVMNADVWGPIELRYQLRYYMSHVNQVEHKFYSVTEKYENDIVELEDMMKREKYVSDCAVNMFHIMITNFKYHISEFTRKYDNEYEKIENDIQYKKLSMEKLSSQRVFFNDQIKSFHEQIEQLHLQELAEKEEALRRAKQLKEEEEALALKASKKGKGKGKGKK